jgi:predicted RNA-binding protein YlxR (DUF448 family)
MSLHRQSARTRAVKSVPTRHVPQRTCVGCREEQPKRALVRIVRAADGRVAVDATGKAAGRGAYLCTRSACWAMAFQRGALARALRTTLSSEDRAALEHYQQEALVANAE